MMKKINQFVIPFLTLTLLFCSCVTKRNITEIYEVRMYMDEIPNHKSKFYHITAPIYDKATKGEILVYKDSLLENVLPTNELINIGRDMYVNGEGDTSYDLMNQSEVYGYKINKMSNNEFYYTFYYYDHGNIVPLYYVKEKTLESVLSTDALCFIGFVKKYYDYEGEIILYDNTQTIVNNIFNNFCSVLISKLLDDKERKIKWTTTDQNIPSKEVTDSFFMTTTNPYITQDLSDTSWNIMSLTYEYKINHIDFKNLCFPNNYNVIIQHNSFISSSNPRVILVQIYRDEIEKKLSQDEVLFFDYWFFNLMIDYSGR